MLQLQWREVEDVFQPTEKCLATYLEENSLKTDIISRYSTDNSAKVFVNPQAIRQLQQHLAEDTTTETGGIIVGQAYWCPDLKINYTIIVGAITAPYTIRNTANFKFTPKCWESILATQKQNYPNTTVVGWYHSHPNFGVFLSATDLKTQRTCFKHDWQIAVVYDPIRHEIGFFHGAEGVEIEPIYLSDERVKDVLVYDDNGLRLLLKETEIIIEIVCKSNLFTKKSDRLLKWKLLSYLLGLFTRSK